ncbi:MAG: DJ-1/PfpI family protein [Hyphomonadaceae bacterium]|nr:DJ-1/PfpI family protein [Hyphomonadaceae bacterium]
MNIGFILFPNVTQLDFTGPLQVLARMPGASTHILAKTMDPVPSDCGLGLMPTATFAGAPKLDLICVPGGFGVSRAIADRETLEFVRSAGAEAQYVTSVCTGAFVLGAVGMLRDKRATTHWAYHHLLPLVGAVPERARVVRDGDVFTGGGVTAGIDFALTIVEAVAGGDAARRIQLALEYDPAPPTPFADARESAREAVGAFYQKRSQEFEAELKTAVGM